MHITSLKTKLIFVYFILVVFVVLIKITTLIMVELPQLYALEAVSDTKDISRIKMAFNAKSKELSVINYDNAVWDDTYHYVNTRDVEFTNTNFVQDTYRSLGINGIHIYDKSLATIWHQAWMHKSWSNIEFSPFNQPSEFVKDNILISEESVSKNNTQPITKSGFTFINNKLIVYSATSIFKANLSGDTNGTMLFWRFFDDLVLKDLQQRTGINFTIEIVEPSLENSVKLSSKDSFIDGSFRTEDGKIFESIQLATGNGAIKFTYQAPVRLFSTRWLNRSTITSSLLFLSTLLLLFVFFHLFIIRPIIRADKMVKAIITNNDRSFRVSSNRKDELGNLFNLIDRLLDDVVSNEQQLVSHNMRLQKISRTDSLTQIPNRRAFDNYMKSLFAISPLNLDVAILICDVDYFKKYNDGYGHAKGDKTLYSIAQTLRKNLHEDTDFVARYGGEEFVIVLKDTNEKDALAVANNLVKIIAELNISHKASEVANHVTISIGLHAFVIANQEQYMPLFELADKALYQAKAQGRNKAIAVP